MAKKKLWLFVLGGVFLGLVLSVITIQAGSATSQSSFCLTCHDTPEFEMNRADTPHAQLDCLSCHGEGFVNDKINGVGHAVSTLTGKMDPNSYADYRAEVSNEKCLSCHNIDSNERDNYIMARHASYIRSEFTCTRCHDNKFFHGKLDDLTKE